MTGLIGRGARWTGALLMAFVLLLVITSVIGGLRHAPQLTVGSQDSRINPSSGALEGETSSLLAYDVWTGQTSVMLSRLESLPVAWSWSPDGSTLTYVLLNALNNTYSVIAFTPVGRQQRQLADGLPFGAPPEWSPDGTRVVLVSPQQDLCLYTVAQPDSVPDCLSVMPAGQPTWSPDGADIAYLSRLPGGGIYRVNVNSRAVRPILPGVPYLSGLRWSPDGTRLAFARQDAPGEPRHLALINADGTGLTALTTDAGNQDQPRWSPDGTEIAYNAFPTVLRAPDVFIVRASDGALRPVATDPQIDADPRWSPDGQMLAFVTDRYDGRPRLQLVTVPAPGQSEPVPDAGVPMYLYSYDWRP